MAAFIHPLKEYLKEHPELEESTSYQHHLSLIATGYNTLWNRYLASWSEDGGNIGDELL